MPPDVGTLLLTLAVGTFLSWLTALVTARHAPPGVKAVVLLALSAVAGFLVALQQDQHDWRTLALGAVEAFTVAVLSHFGLWRPTGLTGADGAIARKVPAGIDGPSR